MANKKLNRNLTEKKVAGVCAGLADYFDADVTAIRVLTLLLIVFTGVFPGLIGYFGAAIIMPSEPAKKS